MTDRLWSARGAHFYHASAHFSAPARASTGKAIHDLRAKAPADRHFLAALHDRDEVAFEHLLQLRDAVDVQQARAADLDETIGAQAFGQFGQRSIDTVLLAAAMQDAVAAIAI